MKMITGMILEACIDEFKNKFIVESPQKFQKIYYYYAAWYGLNPFPYKKCNKTTHLVSAGGAYLKAHAASIASFVVSTVAFAGCEAALGAISFGAGAVAGAAICGAFSGALGALTEYAVNAAQTGKFSWGAMGKAVAVGAIGGAVGGLLGGLGGKAMAFIGKKVAGALGKAATDAVEGAAEGAASDAATEGATTVASDAADTAATSAAEDGTSEATTTAADDASGEASGESSGGDSSKEPESAGCKHSFDPATVVLLADGSTKAIGDIQLGDKVASTDPATGDNIAEPVVELHDNQDTDLADVTVQTSDGATTTLHTTWHHPFWNATDNTWTDAADLKPGTKLRVHDSDDYSVKVISVKTWTGLHHMRDLTVATIHTYYVLAGATAVLVHNVNRPDACTLLLPGENAGKGVPVKDFGKASNSERNAVQVEGDARGLSFMWSYQSTRVRALDSGSSAH